MRRLIWPVLFLLLLLLQGVGSVWYTGWLSCDLVLLALYAHALLRGEVAGAVSGAVVGFLQDAMTVGVFGYHILSRAIFAYLIGLTKEKVFKDNVTYHISMIVVSSLLLRFAYWWLELWQNGGHWDVFLSYWWQSLGMALGNALFVVPMVHVVKYIYDWIKEEDISY